MDIMVEVKNFKQTEQVIEKQGDSKDFYGVKSCTSFRHYIMNRMGRTKNLEVGFMLRGILEVYNKFHPELTTEINLKPWKGKSGFEVIKFPDYFEVIEWRKADPNSEPKRIVNKVSLSDLNAVITVLRGCDGLKTYKTKEIAMKWAKHLKMWKNVHGKRIFDDKGFDYSRISGCRTTFMKLYYPLKICEFYKLIEYGKTGTIRKIRDDLDLQMEFP